MVMNWYTTMYVYDMEKTENDMVSAESIQWADGVVLVYSILDRASFEYVRKARQAVGEAKNPAGPAPPCVLLANKCDMVHLRQVTTKEGMYYIRAASVHHFLSVRTTTESLSIVSYAGFVVILTAIPERPPRDLMESLVPNSWLPPERPPTCFLLWHRLIVYC